MEILLVGILLPLFLWILNREEIAIWINKKKNIMIFYNYLKKYIKDVPNHPFTFFVGLIRYQKLSEILSMRAKSGIIWTIYKSPLLVSSVFNKETLLTEYDEKFVKKICKKNNFDKNFRIVIFKDKEEAQAYENIDSNKNYFLKIKNNFEFLTGKNDDEIISWLKTRKSNFENLHEESHKCKLLFTRADLLLKHFKMDNNLLDDSNFNLEFGFVRWGSGTEIDEGKKCFGFESGYNSMSKNDSNIKHFTIFNINEDMSFIHNEIENDYGIYKNLQLQIDIAKGIYSKKLNNILFKSKEINELCK